MIRLTQSIWTARKGLSLTTHAPTKAQISATTFTVNWNWRNFAIESVTFLPHMIALTIEVKLSSINTAEEKFNRSSLRRLIIGHLLMSDASFATSVPWIPMEKPISAFFNAGPSLVPSPVAATIWRRDEPLDSTRCLTRRYLSCGEDRAKTRRFGAIWSNRCWSTSSERLGRIRRLNSLPSRTRNWSVGVMMPHFKAIDRAVLTLSPVTIRTTIPASRHCSIASRT